MSLLLRWLHVLAALTWIGGMLFIALVWVPVARRLDAPLRVRLIEETGRRFRTVGWIALGGLAATGALNLWMHPVLLGSRRLHAKLGLVVLALVLSLLHDVVLGPRAGRPGADPRLRLHASWVARVNLVAALAIVALGLALSR